MKSKIVLIVFAILLVLTGYFIRGIVQKDVEQIFSNKDAVYSIGLNQSYINKGTKELVEGNVDSLEGLVSMVAYSRDLDSYGRLTRVPVNNNNNNDFTFLFIEFKSLNEEYLDFLKKIDNNQINNFTVDEISYLKEYLKIGEGVADILDSVVRDEYYESDRIVRLISQVRKLRQ